MAEQKTILEKLKELVSDPDALKRFEQAQKNAQETIDFMHKAGELPPNWKEQRLNI